LDRTLFADGIGYLILKLALFIIAVVTIFVTVLAIPPAIQICVVLLIALPGGLLFIVEDKSVSQKRE
jgi:hypothetical protein